MSINKNTGVVNDFRTQIAKVVQPNQDLIPLKKDI